MVSHGAAAGTSPSPVHPTDSTRPTSSAPPASGFFATLRAVRASARLSSTERLVLLVIASYADRATGEAWPSLATIAAGCGLASRTVERTIAALVAAGWLARDTAASRWGTNVYQVTPRPSAAPPPPRRRGRPPTRKVFVIGARKSSSSAPETSGAGSHDPLLRDPHEKPVCDRRAEHEAHVELDAHTDLDVVLTEPEEARDGAAVGSEDVGAGVGDPELPEAAEEAQEAAAVTPGPVTLAAAVAPRTLPAAAPHEAHVEPAADAAAVLAVMAERPELRAIARPPVAALLAAERRPLPVVRRALDELVDAALLAAAAGEPWSASTLARRARAYVRRAYPEPVTSTRPTSTPTPPEPPPEPPRFASSAPYLRGVLAALDTPAPVMVPRRPR